MVVVPHRPVFKALKMLFALGLVGFSGWFCFEYGKNQGLALKVQVVKERDLIEQELAKISCAHKFYGTRDCRFAGWRGH